jgi:hypothetical protein
MTNSVRAVIGLITKKCEIDRSSVRYFGPDASGFGTLNRRRDERHPFHSVLNGGEIELPRNDRIFGLEC